MTEQAEKINYAVELAEHNSSGTAAKINALSDEAPRGKKVINFLKRAAQRRQVVDDERLTARYMITRGRSTNIYSALNNPDVPIITQHILGAVTTKIVAHNNAQQTAKDVVQVASNAGWKTIVLSGNKQFKREAWLQASFVGMEVTGFKPDEQDRANLLQMRARVSANTNTVKKGVETFSEHLKSDARMSGISLKDQESIEALFRSRLTDMASEGIITFKEQAPSADNTRPLSPEKEQDRTLEKLVPADVIESSMKSTLNDDMADQLIGSKSSSQADYEKLLTIAIGQEMPSQSASAARSNTKEKPKAKAKTKTKSKSLSTADLEAAIFEEMSSQKSSQKPKRKTPAKSRGQTPTQ
jgi:hypothetical protein